MKSSKNKAVKTEVITAAGVFDLSKHFPPAAMTDYRKAHVIIGLAQGKTKTLIAQELNVTRQTVGEWINSDPQLSDAVVSARKDLYGRLLDRESQIALGEIETTHEVSYKAMRSLIDRIEVEELRQQGVPTAKGVNHVLFMMCKALFDMPEARQRIIEVFERSRTELGDDDSGPSLLPSPDTDPQPSGT